MLMTATLLAAAVHNEVLADAAPPDTLQSVHLLPEWERDNKLILVWPGDLGDRRHLHNIYRNLFKLLQDNQEIELLVRSAHTRRRLEGILERDHPQLSPRVHALSDLRDIWIKDWAGLPALNENGRQLLVKFSYSPRYTGGIYYRRAGYDDRAGLRLGQIMERPVIFIPLKLHHGNFIHNGEGTGMVFKSIMDDNPDMDRQLIQTLFQEQLNINNLILIPDPPGENTGHLDSIARFVTGDTLILAVHRDEELNGYLERLNDILAGELDGGFNIMRLPTDRTDDHVENGMPSAVGNYLNFLLIGGRIYLPQFGIEGDKAALDTMRKGLPEYEIVPFKSRLIDDMARKGGVLNCISVVY